ncbi:MAG: class I SAM-dependent methyltransferase [Candidatus Binatia bacterium]
MGTDDQERWNARHATEHGEQGPSVFLKQIIEQSSWRIQPGRALDIATGKGRNALFLAKKGFAVEAVDISEVALEQARRLAKGRGLTITFRQVDLNSVELPEAAYDMILNFNFLQRSLIPKIKRALKLGGHIVFETYLIDQRIFGRPKNLAYLLGHNELLEMFRDFRILYYREGKSVEEGREAHRGSLLGQKVS